MWPRTFDARLASWHQLRQHCADLPIPQCLEAINQWWFLSPWVPYHLHWDDRPSWPDPWQLLEDNIYCDLARALGIMYTIVLLERADIQTAQLIEVDSHNLVVLDQEKYILNWDRDQIVNINLTVKKTKRTVSQSQLKQQIK